MKRSKPLARSWIKRKPRRPRRGDDKAYLAWLRTLPCVSCGRAPPSEASHVTINLGIRGIGLKTPDRHAVPHCRSCHLSWDQRTGKFSGWTKERRYARANAWVGLVTLWATPESREQALELQEAGLGTWDEASETWRAGP